MTIRFSGHLIIPQETYDNYLMDWGMEIETSFPIDTATQAGIIVSLVTETGDDMWDKIISQTGDLS